MSTPTYLKPGSRFITIIPVIIIICAATIGILGYWMQMTTPKEPTTEWKTSTPEEQEMDSKKLDQMMDFIDERGLAIDSVIVVRHGHIVLEEYPNPAYSQNQLHEVHSVTKSFISALVGIAIREGFIESVEQRVVDFFPNRTIENLDLRKRSMTLEHLLTMTSGLEWDESTYPYGDTRNDVRQMYLSSDAAQFVLDRPMANDPGVEWLYNSGCSHLLSAIITQATGRSTLDFAREFLFSPLGISNVEWWTYPPGIYYGAGDLHLTPRDMAKFGYLFLKNGTWNGEQIVPEEWVTKSTETSFLPREGTGYGYQWWTLPSSGVYFASGAYGQSIFVLPHLDMVVVFASASRSLDVKEGPRPEPGLLYRFILPACDEYTYSNERYSKYGLSFDYPSGMFIVERGIAGKETASEVSGQVLAGFEIFPEIIGVVWDSAESGPGLEATLDDFFKGLPQTPGTEVADRAGLTSTLKDNHEMVYQNFNVTDKGLVLIGVVGSWYCEEANRVYAFYYLNSPDIIAQKDLPTEFQRHLDSFVCH